MIRVIVLLIVMGCVGCEKMDFRPRYHFLPEKNWMNDPNGPFYDKTFEMYHLFYQYSESGADPEGKKSWGHAVSKDLISWERLPVALRPGDDYDSAGVWSGTVFENERIAIYTGVSVDGVVKDHGSHDHKLLGGKEPDWIQVQCLASPDDLDDKYLTNWTKFKKNPILFKLPEGTTGWRDPQIWKEDDKYHLILSGGTPEKGGVIYLYKSDSIEEGWKYANIFLQANNPTFLLPGENWECTNYIEIKGNNKTYTYVTISIDHLYSVVYFKGHRKGYTFVPSGSYNYYNNGDYYAPQTFDNAKGDKIMIGWIREARPVNEFVEDGWAGMASLPSELSVLPSGQLGFRFIPELEKLRVSQSIHTVKTEISDFNSSISSGSTAIEIICTISHDASLADGKIGIILREGSSGSYSERTYLYYDFHSNQVIIDRSHSSLNPNVDSSIVSTAYTPSNTKTITFHIYIDNSVVEVNIDSVTMLTARIYPVLPNSNTQSLFTQNTYGEIIFDYQLYTLSTIWD